MNTTRPTLPMIPPQTPLRVSGIHGRDIDRKAINELQRIQGELGTGLRKAITVKGGDLDTYPTAADKPNMYKIKWIQMQHEAGEYDSVGDTNVKQDQLSGKDFDAYVFNSASLDPLPLEAYIEEGTILDVHDHNTFCITDYRTDQMRVKAKNDIEGYEGDGCPKIGEAIVLHLVNDCEEEWKDEDNPDDDYKVGEVRIVNIGGAITKDDHFTVAQINGEWYTISNEGVRWAITVGENGNYPTEDQHPNMYKFKFVKFAHPDGNTNFIGETEIEYEEITTEDYDGYVFNVASLDSLPLESYIAEKSIIAVHPHGEFYLTDVRSDQMRVKAINDIEAYKDDGCPIQGQAIVMHGKLDCEDVWKDDANSNDDNKIGEVKIYNVGEAIKAGDIFNVYQISGKWYTGDRSGSKAEIIRFEYVSTESTPSTIDPSASSSEDEYLCTFVPTVVNFPVARVVAPMCGSAWPEDMDIDGNVELTDPLNILDGRRVDDMIGRQGIAVRMEKADDGGSGSGSSESDGCEWVIVYIDFHRWVTVVTDFIINGDDNTITIKRKNVKVWDECRLPDEVIEGADCGAGSSSSGSSSSGV